MKKTLKTVKELTGIEINHVVNVDFQGFANAVDAIDCVYVDVDRDYFNDNSSVSGLEGTYAEIDVNAGYQRLCGQNALDYVRYRHTDTDIVRAARQQDFLRKARAQVPVGEVLPILGGDIGSDLLDIFTEYTTSDIDDADQMIGTLKAFLAVRERADQAGQLRRDARGRATSTATPEQIEKAVDEFLSGEDTAGPDRRRGCADETKSEKEGKKDGKKKEEKDPTRRRQRDLDRGRVARMPGVRRSTSSPRSAGPPLAGSTSRSTSRPRSSPGPATATARASTRSRTRTTTSNHAYKIVIALRDPSTAARVLRRQGDHLGRPADPRQPLRDDRDRRPRLTTSTTTATGSSMVAWHDDEDNSYWVSNTLLGTLDEDDMLAIAKSIDEAHAK